MRGTNGKSDQQGKGKGGRPKAKSGLTRRKRSAVLLGCIGVALMGLSVTHCTEAIQLLTGSSWPLSALLAVGIDAGMVASEWAALTAHGTQDGREVGRWATVYVVATVLLSVLLNCYAFGRHAAEGMAWAAYVLGVFVPAAIYTLGRVAGKQWLSD